MEDSQIENLVDHQSSMQGETLMSLEQAVKFFGDQD